MNLRVGEFRWYAPVDGEGYRWLTRAEVHNVRRDGPFFDTSDLAFESEVRSDDETLVLASGVATRFRAYRPLADEPALFRVFGELDPTKEALLSFANRYGPLVYHRAVNQEGQEEAGTDNSRIAGTILGWEYQQKKMAQLLRLWGLIIEAKEEPLREIISWKGDYVYARLWGEEKDYPLGQPPGGAFIPGALLQPARVFLDRMVSGSMVISGKVTIGVEWDCFADEDYLEVMPLSLLGAMYFQFAQAIAEKKQYRRCVVCNRWIELSPRINRVDRLTCGNSCRMALYRNRQEQARKMFKKGKTVKEIARALDAEVAAVKNWVKPTKG